jgi:MFS family permease
MCKPSRRPLLLLLFATLMAGAGNGISTVAFPWLALQRTGSALDASIVAGAASLPLLFSTLFAGVAVDFLGRKRISILCDLSSGSAVAAIPLLALTVGEHILNVGAVAALAALAALFDSAGITARQSMLPEAAEQAGWTLERVNSLYAAIFNIGYVVGPGLGGVAITAVGGINTMWVTASVFALSSLAVSALRLAGATAPAVSEHRARPWSEMVAGLRFVWNVKVLRTLAVIDLAATGLYIPMESVLFPKFFTDHNDPAHLGWVLMALYIGGPVGALAYPVLARRRSQRSTLVIAILALGICTGLISLFPPLPVVLLLCALIGLSCGPLGPIYNSTVLTKSPPQLRGRVVGVMTSLAYVAGPLGLMLAGPLTDAAGLRTTFMVLAIPMLTIGLVSLGLPSLRELDHSLAADTASAVDADA